MHGVCTSRLEFLHSRPRTTPASYPTCRPARSGRRTARPPGNRPPRHARRAQPQQRHGERSAGAHHRRSPPLSTLPAVRDHMLADRCGGVRALELCSHGSELCARSVGVTASCCPRRPRCADTGSLSFRATPTPKSFLTTVQGRSHSSQGPIYIKVDEDDRESPSIVPDGQTQVGDAGAARPAPAAARA